MCSYHRGVFCCVGVTCFSFCFVFCFLYTGTGTRIYVWFVFWAVCNCRCPYASTPATTLFLGGGDFDTFDAPAPHALVCFRLCLGCVCACVFCMFFFFLPASSVRPPGATDREGRDGAPVLPGGAREPGEAPRGAS